jgi:16S rRNA (guanine1207-N2)-methyltransferase
MALDLSSLRRHPDVEAPNLYAVDATDRLLLDEAAAAIVEHPDAVVVVDDHYGALTIGARGLGARKLRVHQDSVVGERALAGNARARDVDDVVNVPLTAGALAGAEVVLWQLPGSLDRLDAVARVLAEAVAPDAVVYAGGRIKHMTTGMNEVLRRHFDRLDVSLARQKSRVLIVREPRISTPDPSRVDEYAEWGMRLIEAPGVFAGGRLDLGARALLAALDHIDPGARTAVDLGCGAGVLSVALARLRPELAITATDTSAAAVDATLANLALNEVTTVTVTRDDCGSNILDASVDVVLLNPPFHSGTTVHTGIAQRMFAAAARMLRPGGELWAVYNSPLSYRSDLTRMVGPTREVSRNPKFTVTVSEARGS